MKSLRAKKPHLPAVTNQKNAGLTDERVKSSKDTQPKLVCWLDKLNCELKNEVMSI